MPKQAQLLKASKSTLFIGGFTLDAPLETAWMKVGLVADLSGSIGGTWRTADSTVLDSDFEFTQKVLRAGGDLDATLQFNIADVGQVALRNAYENGENPAYNFKIEMGDKPPGATSKPTIFYFEAHVLSFTVPGFSPTRLVQRKVKLDIQGAMTEVAKVTGA